MWIGPSVLGLSRHGRAEFTLRDLSIRQGGRRELSVQFLVASPRFMVPLPLERRHNNRADRAAVVAPAAGDLGVEMLARMRILDACCAKAKTGAAIGAVPPPAVLDMTTDVLAGLTQAYRDLGRPL